MTKNLPAIPQQDQRVASALRFHAAAHTSAAQMAIAAAKCGLELKAIKKDVGHGAFEGFFARHFATHGLTLRTAQRYMALADGLKGKALKNDTGSFLKLLDSAPSSLSEKEQATLTKSVSKVTDGKALSELYQDFGIVKKPQGSGAKGGNTRAQALANAAAAAAAAANQEPVAPKPEDVGWHAITKLLNNLLVEHLDPTNQYWNHCSEARRSELHGNLVDATAAVAATLKKETRA